MRGLSVRMLRRRPYKVLLNMKKTKKLAAGAVLCSVGVAVLLIGNIISVLDLSMVVIASLAVVFAVIEMGSPYPYLIYAVTGILAVILLPDKTIALEYILFGGIYPIFKAIFERFHYVVSWILKLSAFNTGLLLLIFIAGRILHIPDTGFEFTLAVFAAANVFFVVYDIALGRIITFYIVVLRKRLGLKDLF